MAKLALLVLTSLTMVIASCKVPLKKCTFCRYYEDTGNSPFALLGILSKEISRYLTKEQLTSMLLKTEDLNKADEDFKNYCNTSCTRSFQRKSAAAAEGAPTEQFQAATRSGGAASFISNSYSKGYLGGSGAGSGYYNGYLGGSGVGSGYSKGYLGGSGVVSGYSNGYLGGSGVVSGYSKGYLGGSGVVSGYSNGYLGGSGVGSGYSKGFLEGSGVYYNGYLGRRGGTASSTRAASGGSSGVAVAAPTGPGKPPFPPLPRKEAHQN